MLISGIVLLYSALFVFVFICKTVKFRVIRMSRITGMLFLGEPQNSEKIVR